MKKICLALAGSALVLAGPAMASTVLISGFKTLGDCSSALHWMTNNERQGWGHGMTADIAQLVDGGLVCVQSNGLWQIQTA